jgi:Holliday junction resolvase RusA-like endonuclease
VTDLGLARGIDFMVRGDPVGQGGMTAFVVGGTARVAHKNSTNLRAWRNAVATQAQAAMGDQPVMDAPVEVIASFTFSRPKAHYGARGIKPSAPSWKATKPDADKAIRSVLDALTGVVWRDDSLVVRMLVEKRYGDTPGVRVSVRVLG